MQKVGPVFLVELFPLLNKKLIELLKSLTDEDWQKPTIARFWTVKDIAAHILDGNLRRLSIQRDQYLSPEKIEINSYLDLVNYLNQLNADWVKAYKRISPQLIIQQLEQTGNELYESLKAMNPYEKALFPVSWAGESESQHWFDIAREYTEKWHHQQQIRLAVNQPGIMNDEFYYPLLDTFMRALPYTYRDVKAVNGTLVQISISGRNWFLYHHNSVWELVSEINQKPDATVEINGEIAWRLFTKGISKEDAKMHYTINGEVLLGEKALEMISVMA